MFDIVVCERCGLKFTNPRPEFEKISAYYGRSYYSYQRPDATVKRLKMVPGPRPRFLDYGCGAGHKMIEKINAGYKAFGVEISDDARSAGQSLGLDIRKAHKDKLEFDSNYFDEIHINNVLEHLHSPLAMMSEFHRCLKSGGRLWLEVPNIESYDAQLYGSFWRHLDVPRHLVHFSPYTLRRLLQLAGFRTFQISTKHIPALSIERYYAKGLYTIFKIKFRTERGRSTVRFFKSLWFVFYRFMSYLFHEKNESNGALLQAIALKSCCEIPDEQHIAHAAMSQLIV